MAEKGFIRKIVDKATYVAGELQAPRDPGHPDAAFRERPKTKSTRRKGDNPKK